MDNLTLTLLLLLIGLCFLGSLTGAYFFGFVRGSRSAVVVVDPTPVEHTPENIAPDVTIELMGYLDATTGPVTITPLTQSIEIVAVRAEEVQGSAALIAMLTAKLERAERLRKRYLRLLREERAMMRGYFSPGHRDFKWSPYWARWVGERMRIVDETFAAAGWGSEGIANTR